MYPYGWNGFQYYSGPYAPGAMGFYSDDLSDRNLPDEVREALENHRDEIHTVDEREEFLNRLDLMK